MGIVEGKGNMERLTRRDKVDGNEFVRINKGAPDFVVYEKLADYEDLEEQNRLLKLPCAVGDTIYAIYSDEDSSFIEEPKVVEVSTHRVWIDSAYFDYDDFGKTVFLTREEAEAALKELERGNG